MLNIPTNAFQLLDHSATHYDYNRCERENRPVAHITRQQGGYQYMEIDFITCDWCISPVGQAMLQTFMNHEVVNMLKRGLEPKENQTNIGQMICTFRSDMQGIEHIIKEMNRVCQIPNYWQQYRLDGRNQEITRDDTVYTRTVNMKHYRKMKRKQGIRA
ncbi:hypothetical protein ERX35_000950 [Macrococcus equipercicus]|uniref:Uncharacterized protein n=1 Tax=Macrococcus equipercicus TaxID=69967 RepID=A0ABQ6RBA6_9STAP|nr:hypothetical protein [Macrococcus equipercicus]KAA1042480.1 hypothetical protein ERX35_000950 [Macrococcus equipercicus]